MKNFLKICFCLLILGTAFIPLYGTIVGLESINLDKSTLAPMPILIKDKKLNTNFISQFDDFFTDQFFFRTTLISAYNGVFERIFKLSGNDKVIVGDNGFLFFEETLDDYLKTNQLSDYDLLRINEVLRIQQSYLQNQKINSHFMVVPNKATIYGEYMPSRLKPLGDSSNLDRLMKMNLNINFIDLKTPMMTQKSVVGDLLYHQKDSHWNNIGALIGYLEMMKSLDKESLPLLDQSYSKRNDWQGDLARMLYPSHPTTEQQMYFPMPKEFTFTRAIRTFEDLEIESVNNNIKGDLIMFRDSFANALIPYISESFAQVNYLRLFPYDYKKIEGLNASNLIIEIAERNLNWMLQATPVLVQTGVEIDMNAQMSVPMDFVVEQEKKSDMYYLNARFNDPILAEKVVAVRLMYNGVVYDAFPIYQDEDFEDDVIKSGFSIYTTTEIQPDTMTVYVYIDNQWKKAIRP
jgi:hypothetical protein